MLPISIPEEDRLGCPYWGKSYTVDMKRDLGVNLVVLSGLKKPVFKPAVNRFREQCDGVQKIPIVSTPFLRWTFYGEIMKSLDETAQGSMRHVYKKWDARHSSETV